MKNRFLCGIVLFMMLLAPVAAISAIESMNYAHKWTFDHDGNPYSQAGGAEIAAFLQDAGQIWVIGGDGVDIVSISDGSLVNSINTESYGSSNSIAIHGDMVAIAFAADPITEPGQVVFFDQNGNQLASYQVGANPDMVKFTPDGKRLLVANEGEPDNGVDPDGSVSIIDISVGVAAATVTTATFTAFNGQEDLLRDNGVRIFPDNTVSKDVEPEYIAVTADGTKAFITLQENNSLAELDIDSSTITAIRPLGLKDHSLPGNGLDPSDKDGGPMINTWPVYGMYMPDGIDAFSVNGLDYLITANEGDARDEDSRSEDLHLDTTVFTDPTLQYEENLGRLEVSTIDGYVAANDNYIRLQSYGARSFSIWDTNGDIVYDSGDHMERTLSEYDGGRLWQEKRCDNKGPEPEGAAVLSVGNNHLAFVGLERSHVVMVYDVTNPTQPVYLGLIEHEGDEEPEGIVPFIYNNTFFLAVANEESKTTTLYQLSLTFPYNTIESVQAPTMNEWGMIIFMLFAGLFAVYQMRRNGIN